MNPDTGKFHELFPSEGTRDLAAQRLEAAERIERRSEALKHLYSIQKAKLKPGETVTTIDPRMADLVMKSGKPVPASWPIFSIGDMIEIIDLYGTARRCTIKQVTKRDIILESEVHDLVFSDNVFFIQDHQFRCRKVEGNVVSIRPIVGQSHNYIKR